MRVVPVGSRKKQTKTPKNTNGCCELVAVLIAHDMAAGFDKVTEISDRIARPGYRIRVKDHHGDAVFVGVTTGQWAHARDQEAA